MQGLMPYSRRFAAVCKNPQEYRSLRKNWSLKLLVTLGFLRITFRVLDVDDTDL